MKYLVNLCTHNYDDISFAIVEVDALTAREWQRWVGRCRGDRYLKEHPDKHSFELTFFEYSGSPDLIDYFDVEAILGEDVYEAVENEGCSPIPHTPAVVESKRSECDRIHLTCDGVYWTSIPKHCDEPVKTQEIPWSVLTKEREWNFGETK
jgi:hypothetical protein